MKKEQTASVSFRPERFLSAAIDWVSIYLSHYNMPAVTPRRYIILATDGVP